MKKELSIKRVLIVIVIIIICAPFVLFFIPYITNLSNQLNRELEDKSEIITTATGEWFNFVINNNSNILNVVKDDVTNSKILSDNYNHKLKNIADNSDYVRSIAIIDMDNNVEYSSSLAKQIELNTFLINDLSMNNNKYSINFYHYLKNNQTDIYFTYSDNSYHVILEFHIDKILNFLNNIRGHYQIGILDSKRDKIIETSSNNSVIQKYVSGNFSSNSEKAFQYHRITDETNKTAILTIYNLNNINNKLDWLIYSYTYDNNIYEAKLTLILMLITATIILLLLSIILTIFFISLIEKGLRTLRRNTAQLSKGNYNISFLKKSRVKEINEINRNFMIMITSINEREKHIKRREQEYKLLLETITDCICFINSDKTIKLINQAFCNLINQEYDFIINKKIYNILDNPLKHEIIKNYERVKKLKINKEYKTKINIKIENKDVNKYLKIKMYSIHDDVLVILTDITDQMMAEISLRESEAVHRDIIEYQTEFISRYNEKGEITFVNDAFCKYFNKSKEEILGTHFRPEIIIEDMNDVLKKLRTLNKINTYIDKEFRIIKDNEIKWHKWTIRLLYDQYTGEKEYLSVGRDITEEKDIKNQLIENEKQLKKFVESLPIGILVLKSDGKEYFMNYAASKILHSDNYSEDELIDIATKYNIYKTNTDEYYPYKDNPVYKALNGYNSYKDDMFIKYNDEKILIEVWGVPIFDYKKDVEYVVGVITDISERKLNNKKLNMLNKELENSNKDLEDFAFVVSHDLQEPVRTISWYIKKLLNLDEISSTKSKKYIEIIKDGSERVINLIEDLLKYSRVNRKGNRFESYEVKKIIEKTLDTMKYKFLRNNVQIETNISAQSITLDFLQIKTVLRNLISNAIKFNNKDSIEIHIKAEDNDGSVVFCIKDNGIGIDKRYYKKVFEIFQRLHTREEYPGTGIGLALCKRIIDRHKGNIWVQSEGYNTGSAFYFSIPKKIGDSYYGY